MIYSYFHYIVSLLCHHSAKPSVPEPVKKHSVARRQHYQPQQHSIKEKRK